VFVRTAADARAAGHEREISHGTATATRYLTKRDGLGFSFSTVFKAAGQDAKTLWYKHHWEANFVVAGAGELEELSTGRRWPLEPGTLYVVGPDDRHKVHATEDLRIVSVFNPPIVGDETHDADGSYPPSGPLPPGPSG
jgi:L-ectoine synthase